MAEFEWVEVDPSKLPPPAPKCPKNIFGHKWLMTVEEGTPTFGIADGEECLFHDYGDGQQSVVCQWELADYLCNDPAMVQMNDSIPVSLNVHVERGYYGDDVYSWVDVESLTGDD